MSIVPTFTRFDRSAVPTNLLTVPEYRRLSHETYNGVSWRTAARKVARVRGGALVLRADGSLVAFTRRENGRIEQRTHAAGKWGWDV
jgi:hypothetical protein